MGDKITDFVHMEEFVKPLELLCDERLARDVPDTILWKFTNGGK
jgi:hypothetical protein